MKKLYLFFIAILIGGLAFGQTVFINEIHYDNSGADVNEGVEIAGPAGTDLSTYTLTPYNGNGGALYSATALSGTIPDEGSGYGALWFPISGLQNGAPDGIALDNSGSLIQFLSYEGTFSGVGGPADSVMSTDIGVSEAGATAAGSSLQLTGTGTEYSHFSWSGETASSYGLINAGQTFGTPVPTLALVDAPASGGSVTVGPEDLNGELEFVVTNFTLSGDAGGGVSDGNGDGYIYWAIVNVTDGYTLHDSGKVFDPLAPIPFTTLLPNKEYFLSAELRDNSGTALGNPESYYALTAYTLGYNVVADITALRADVTTNGDGLYYEITGTSLVTHTDSFRNRQWIQETNTSGILIYDPDAISSTFTVGDIVTGLKGQTQDVNGVLALVPSIDAGVVQSSGNPITPQLVTISDFNSNYEDYESEIIELQNVTFDEADGAAVFATGTNYHATDAGLNTVVMRTDYFSADYIGSIIPTSNITSLIAVAGEFNTTPQIYARSLSDMTLSNDSFKTIDFSLYPNPTALGYINISSKNQTAMKVGVYDILGKQVISDTVTNNRLDVSKLNTGIYVMKISQDNATVTKKLVIN